MKEFPLSDKAVDKHLDRMRDEFYYSVYKCSCGFRGFGAPVMVHEMQNKSHGAMIREIPMSERKPNANKTTL